MDYDLIKNRIQSLNPIARQRRRKMRQELRNTTPTLLTPNCLGGILFHDLGLRFCSPTVNLMMTQTDFKKFVCSLEYYLNQKLEFYHNSLYSFPCAHLGDISLHFTHYKTEREAAEKWYSRCKRVDFNNLFIVALERDGLTKEDIIDIGKIKSRGVVVFTAHNYPDIPYTLYLKDYQSVGEVGNILKRNIFDDSRKYEEYFDFVKWFNESTTNNHNINDYHRKK